MNHVTVISSCQTYGLTDALQMMLPNMIVSGFDTSVLLGPDRHNISTHIQISESVIALPLPDNFQEFSKDRISTLNKNITFVPQFEFSGLHPDVIYITDKKGGWARSPMIDYHSNIAVAAYLNGLDVPQTVQLYNSYIFDQLEYFDFYKAAKRATVDKFSQYNIDLIDGFEQWEAVEEPFMWSINHPKIKVLFYIAAKLLDSLGLKYDIYSCASYMLQDRLSQGPVLPVFPEIGRRHGFQGCRLYRSSGPYGTSAMSLSEHLEKTFDLYKSELSEDWVIPNSCLRSREILNGLLSQSFR